jgi:hypothetical protein
MAQPLDRSWFNSLVDDTGDGVSGTVWNKSQINSLLTAIDSSLAGVVDKAGSPAVNEIALFSDPDTLKTDGRLYYDPTFAQLVIRGGATTSGGSRVAFGDFDQPADRKWMRLDHAGQALAVSAVGDAGGVLGTPLLVQRDGDVQVLRKLTVVGGQVEFPSTDNPSASPITLDCYREFTWTPKWTATGGASGTTYTTQVGHGVKVGRKVTCWAMLIVASPGSMAGALALWGLPYFAGGQLGGAVGAVTVSAFSGSGIAFSSIGGYVNASVDWAELTYMPAGGGTALQALPASAIIAGTAIYCQIDYQAAS